MLRPGDAVGTAGLELGDDEAPSPQASMALIHSSRREVARRLLGSPERALAGWGIAWLLGFGACYLASSGPRAALPAWVAYLILGVACATAGVVSAVETVRPGRGIIGPSRRVAVWYGWSWGLAYAGLFVLILGLAVQGLSPTLLARLWPGLAVLIGGVLYVAGGALWQDRLLYLLGAWTVIVGATSTFAGTPGNFAVLSFAGGGGLIVVAILLVLRRLPGRSGA
jgi:hypothetical protein